MAEKKITLKAAERLKQTEIKAIQIIDALEGKDLAHHLKNATRGLHKSARKIGTYQGATVYITGDHSNNYLLLVYEDEILYLIRTETVKMGGLLFGQQVMAVRNYESNYSALAGGFALHAFMKILLPKYHVLVSDAKQTRQGQAAFAFVAKTALQRKKFLYLYDRRSTPNRWVPIKSLPQLAGISKILYGEEEGFQTTLVVISDSEIAPTNPGVKVD